MAKSPSITIFERDASSYPVTTSETILAIVGYATNGAMAKPTLVTSRNEFIKTFGIPTEDAPWSHLAAYRAFNQGNQIYFTRIGDTASGDTGAVKAQRVIYNREEEWNAGDSLSAVQIEAKNFGSDNNNLSLVISFETDPVLSTNVYKIEIYYKSSLRETFSNLSMTSGDTNFFETVINRDEDNGGSSLITIDTYLGSGDSADSRLDFSGDSTGKTYLIGDSDSANGDTYPFVDGDSWPMIGDTSYDFKAGLDGVITGDSDSANLHAEVLTTNSDLANIELYDYHVLITPDNGNSVTTDAAVALAEYRKDFIYIADPPQSLTYSQVIAWHNGSGQGRSTAINSSYAATYWPWLKDYNINTGNYIWCPPSVFIAEKLMEVDRLYGPWYAVAGDVRGRITASDYEASPSLAQRDLMYGGLNAVNPIVYFNQKGLEIFGQKTLLRRTTSLNRLNVRRMVIYVKKLIKRSMDGIVFEPHVADSWTKATNIINSILEPVRQGGGLEDYRVIIDSTTNTADLIAQNIMKGIIKLLPVGTIEIIELSIQLFNPGSSIE